MKRLYLQWNPYDPHGSLMLALSRLVEIALNTRRDDIIVFLAEHAKHVSVDKTFVEELASRLGVKLVWL